MNPRLDTLRVRRSSGRPSSEGRRGPVETAGVDLAARGGPGLAEFAQRLLLQSVGAPGSPEPPVLADTIGDEVKVILVRVVVADRHPLRTAVA